MNLLALLRRESTMSIRTLLLLAGIAGVSNAGVLAIINSAVADATNKEHSAQDAMLFVIFMTIYFVAQRHVMLTAIEEIEMVLARIRVRIANKIRHVDLKPLEDIGWAAIYSSVQKETMTISQSASILVLGIQFSILVFFTAIYVAWLSLPAFFLSAITTTAVAVFFLKRAEQLKIALHETLELENKLFDSLTNLLKGFKEIRMNTARSRDVFESFQQISDAATASKIKTQAEVSSQFILSQIAFYFMVAVVVFIVPQLSSTFSETIVEVTTAILFLIGPIGGVVNAVPNLATANAATESILELESLLETSANEVPDVEPKPINFKEIALEHVVFTYGDSSTLDPFTVGPIDLKIKAGEMVFISGGNGVGKSTLLKLLTTLYYPIQGVVSIDGQPIGVTRREDYRNLFSVIFTDYHLFDRLYGLTEVDPERIEQMIDYLELPDKVKVVNHEFETLQLSGGQRKRLALLVCLLEDRPICIFDEVAADQDPAFRRKYYEEILPTLKEQGKTIVAVTHDDQYFDVADRLLKLEAGRIVNDD